MTINLANQKDNNDLLALNQTSSFFSAHLSI